MRDEECIYTQIRLCVLFVHRIECPEKMVERLDLIRTACVSVYMRGVRHAVLPFFMCGW